MKRMIAFLLMFLMGQSSMAGLIETTLIEHVMPVTQFKSAETRVALMDSIVLIGSVNESSILDIQAGFNSDVAPESGEVGGADFVVGGFFKVNPFLEKKMNLPAHWEFLRALEHGPYLHYDFRREGWYGGYQVGLAFSLEPK